MYTTAHQWKKRWQTVHATTLFKQGMGFTNQRKTRSVPKEKSRTEGRSENITKGGGNHHDIHYTKQRTGALPSLSKDIFRGSWCNTKRRDQHYKRRSVAGWFCIRCTAVFWPEQLALYLNPLRLEEVWKRGAIPQERNHFKRDRRGQRCFSSPIFLVLFWGLLRSSKEVWIKRLLVQTGYDLKLWMGLYCRVSPRTPPRTSPLDSCSFSKPNGCGKEWIERRKIW